MTLLLLQITIVLTVTLACGTVARRLGQTRVIGEIVGGVLIGPSVLGRLAPEAAQILFPASSLAPLEALSTIGLVLFLFLIGTALDFTQLRAHSKTAALSSTLSILLPFAFAAVLAGAIQYRFAPAGIDKYVFLLFLGISLSITAFPVLARILEERGLESTALGTTAVLCAAVDDVVAWLVLALALALLNPTSQVFTLPLRLLALGVYLIVMLAILRPLANHFSRTNVSSDLSRERFALTLIVILASAAATDAIGVHPLFGAFIAGLCFPRIPAWQANLRARLDTVVSVLLLPLFFALTGMKTRIDLLSTPAIWLWTGILLLAAISGKMGGAVIAARSTGQSWNHAFALGALLNTRGLVELIVLNIAYNAHVFSPTLFTMLVVMALVTTFMTTPLLNLLGIRGIQRTEQKAT